MCGNVIAGDLTRRELLYGEGEFLDELHNGTARYHQRGRSAKPHPQPLQRRGLRVGGPVPAARRRAAIGAAATERPAAGGFSPETIGLWERLADYLAVALAKFRAEDELRVSNENLWRFNHAAVDRELRMIELKKEIDAKLAAAGQPPRYPLAFEKARK